MIIIYNYLHPTLPLRIEHFLLHNKIAYTKTIRAWKANNVVARTGPIFLEHQLMLILRNCSTRAVRNSVHGVSSTSEYIYIFQKRWK